VVRQRWPPGTCPQEKYGNGAPELCKKKIEVPELHPRKNRGEEVELQCALPYFDR